MKIDVAKDDLWWVRNVLSEAIWQMEHCPNPSSHSKGPAVCRKMNRKLSRAMKKAFGHDMCAEDCNC